MRHPLFDFASSEPPTNNSPDGIQKNSSWVFPSADVSPTHEDPMVNAGAACAVVNNRVSVVASHQWLNHLARLPSVTMLVFLAI